MATQDKNLVVYNNGELQKVGASDKVQIYAADFDQNVAIAGSLSVVGSSTLAGLSAGATTVAALTASSAQINGTLGVTGLSSLAGLSAGSSTLASASITGAATVGETLAVTGASTFTGAISGSSASLSGTLGAGATTLASANITGNETVGGDLTVTGATALSSLTTSGNASVTGTLGVTGATTLSSTLNAGASTLSSATITNGATVGGTLGVTGATTLSSTLNAGASTLASATISGAASVGGTLGVTGAATLSSSLSVTGVSTFTGDMTAGNIDASTLDVSGAATVGQTLAVTGATTLSNNLSVGGNATVTGTLNAGASTLASATVSGALSAASATVSGALSAGTTSLGSTSVTGTLGATGAVDFDSTLNVDSVATLNSLVVTNGASVGSTLGVTGAATFGNTLSVTGAASLNNNLSVGGTSTLTGAASLGNNLSVVGTSTLSGAVSASSTLAVAGVASFANDVNVTGDLTVNGSIISRGSQDVVIRDAFLDLAFGDFSGDVTSGGFTVSMNKAVGFTAENVSAFTAGAAGIAPSFTVSGTTAFAVGDIVAITLAGDSENDGLFAVKAVVGSEIAIEASKIGSAPFLQNQFVTATGQSAKAYKVDLAAVAVADGANFPQADVGGLHPAWPKGTFITLFKPAATISGSDMNNVCAFGAWQSVGQVGLNEAYATDNIINLSNGRDLIVNAPAAGSSAAIKYVANADSYLKIRNADLDIGVWDDGGVSEKSAIKFDDSLVAGQFDIFVAAGGMAKIDMQAGQLVSIAKGGNASWKVVDNSGATTKGELAIDNAGSVTLTANGGNLNLDAGGSKVVAIASDTLFKAELASDSYASVGMRWGVAASTAAGVVVTASGAVASPTAPNILGATISSESGGMADMCSIHGSLVRINKAATSPAFSVGDVAYLAAGGEISKTPPSAPNDYVMRVGYVVARAGSAQPVVQFAPQFIAKVL